MPDAYEHLRQIPLNVILTHLGFEDWKWRKSGTEAFGPCPQCKPKRNKGNFSFDETGKFNCFSGCGLSGKGAIDIVMKLRKCGFKTAVEALQGISQVIPVEKPRIPAKELEPARTENPVFNGASYAKYAVPCPWLEARGITDDTLKHFGVFCYSNPARKSIYSGKVMIPVHRFKDGQLVAYLARDTNPEAEVKYQWPKEFQKSLEVFGSTQLKEKTPLRVLYLLESPFAVMAFHQYGLPAVSPFGFSVSSEQAATIAQLAKGVVYLCDRNKRDQISNYIEALSRQVWVKAPFLPATIEDPESLTLAEIQELT